MCVCRVGQNRIYMVQANLMYVCMQVCVYGRVCSLVGMVLKRYASPACCDTAQKGMEKKRCAGNESYSPHQIRKRSTLVRAPLNSSTKKENKEFNEGQEGYRFDLEPAPCWELIIMQLMFLSCDVLKLWSGAGGGRWGEIRVMQNNFPAQQFCVTTFPVVQALSTLKLHHLLLCI